MKTLSKKWNASYDYSEAFDFIKQEFMTQYPELSQKIEKETYSESLHLTLQKESPSNVDILIRNQFKTLV